MSSHFTPIERLANAIVLMLLIGFLIAFAVFLIQHAPWVLLLVLPVVFWGCWARGGRGS